MNNFYSSVEPSSNPTNFGTHGERWGEMIIQLASYVQYYENITIDAAMDIEFPWNSPGRTRSWKNGYAYTTLGTGHYYYNFGDCNDCYPTNSQGGQPNVDPPYNKNITDPLRSWYLDDIRYLSALGGARPLPQIYYPVRNSTNPHAPTIEQCCQWENVSRWAYDTYRKPFSFNGITSGWQSSQNATYTLTAEDAWKQFMEALNSDPYRRTPVQLLWLTDITNQGHAP